MSAVFVVRAKRVADNARLASAWTERYGAVTIVSRGRNHYARELAGFVAEESGKILGALTYRRDGDDVEVVTLDSFAENLGVGSALLEAAVNVARDLSSRRIWLVTSNDNIRAIRFYQRRGWDMAALHRDAIIAARKVKPEIPMLGDHDIPIRHEIEFELVLQ